MSTNAGQYNNSKSLQLVVGCLLVAVLYVGKELWIPIALATLISFLLQPIVILLRKLHVPKTLAVVVVTIMSLVIVLAANYMIYAQIVRLSQKLPDYHHNLIARIQSLKSKSDSTLGKMTSTIHDIKVEMANNSGTTQPSSKEFGFGSLDHPIWVKVVESAPDPFGLVKALALPVAAPLATAGVVFLLTALMLLNGHHVVERIVWLGGNRSIPITTAALGEAGERIGRYLRMQLLVNSCYGLFVGVMLALIKIPNPFLWGAMAGAMRYIPFVGSIIGAVPPFLLSLAIFTGWSQPLIVVAVFIGADVLANSFFEPWLYGSSTGMSNLGIVFASLFWGWLWGPVGLIMAVPITASLVVLGRYVPSLKGISVFLGSSPALTPAAKFYQFLIAGREEDSLAHIVEILQQPEPIAVCDDTVFPALRKLKIDFRSGAIDSNTFRTARIRVEKAIEKLPKPKTPVEDASLEFVLCAYRRQVDFLAAMLLGRLLSLQGISVKVVPWHELREDNSVAPSPRTLIITTISPTNEMGIHRVHSRLRKLHPSIPIKVAIWPGSKQLSKSVRHLRMRGQRTIIGRVAKFIKILGRTASRPQPVSAQ